MQEKIKNLLDNWKKRNILGFYCASKEQAEQKLLEIIPVSGRVGISGSVTLEELAIVKRLEARGNKVFDQYKSGINREEGLELRRSGASADFYLASANAISEKGELVFFSGYGNRIAGVSYCPNTLIICGVNKIAPNLEEALKRAREYATPLNCKRLGNWDTPCLEDGICRKEICFSPDYKRMCCQILIIEAEAVPERLKVILVDEKLGF